MEPKVNNELNSRPTAELFSPELQTWESVSKDILEVEEKAFFEYDPQEEILRADFENPRNVIALLKTPEGQIIGYSYAEPIDQPYPERASEGAETAYVTATAIHPDYQKQGLLRDILGTLDGELRKRGYSFVERDAIIKYEYPDQLEKLYEDRIVEQREEYDEETEEMVRFMRITL